MLHRTLLALVLLMALIWLNSGCESSNRKDLVGSGDMKLETHPTQEAQFSKPAVYLEDGALEVSGTVRLAKPLADDGRHVHLDVLSADGQYVDLIEADLAPNPENPKDAHSASYSVLYFYTPPKGATMSVSLAEAQCWNAPGGGNEKAGALADYNQGGAKAKTVGSKPAKAQYQVTNRAARPRGYKSPGYRSASGRK